MSTRNFKDFREQLLAALGSSGDHDVENEINFKNALLDALKVEHTMEDVRNFEQYREKLIEGVAKSGGSGEFTTAVMTFTVDSNETYQALPHITENGISTENIALTAGSNEIIVPLYNGKLTIFDDFNATISKISGDIEFVDYCYVITGDCTVHYESV